MSTWNIVIGLAIGILLAGALVAWRAYYRDIFGAFLVVGLLALAVVVTIYQVHQYREQQTTTPQIAQSQPQPMAGSGSSIEAPRPPVAVAFPPAGARGAAAPAAARNPYTGAGNP